MCQMNEAVVEVEAQAQLEQAQQPMVVLVVMAALVALVLHLALRVLLLHMLAAVEEGLMLELLEQAVQAVAVRVL